MNQNQDGLENRLISIISEAVIELKPKVEEKTDTKIWDVFVGEYSPYTAGEFYDPFLNSEKGRFMAIPPNKILFTNPGYATLRKFLIDDFNDYYRLVFKHAALHELYHIASFKLNKRFELTPKNKLELRLTNILCEGFACYMTLDGSEFLYRGFNKDIVEEFRKKAIRLFKQDHNNFDDHYYIGYMLAKKIVDFLGEGELLRLIKDIDIELEETYNPELYILRRRNEIR